MPTLSAEFDAPEACPHAFAGDTSDLVCFLSFAFSARYLPVRQAGRSTQGPCPRYIRPRLLTDHAQRYRLMHRTSMRIAAIRSASTRRAVL